MHGQRIRFIQLIIGTKIIFYIQSGIGGRSAQDPDGGKMIGEQDLPIIGALIIREIGLKEIIRHLIQPQSTLQVGAQYGMITPEGLQYANGLRHGIGQGMQDHNTHDPGNHRVAIFGQTDGPVIPIRINLNRKGPVCLIHQVDPCDPVH